MEHGKIIIHEAQAVIQYASSYVIFLNLHLCQSLTQCLQFAGFDERFYYICQVNRVDWRDIM